MEQIMAYLDEQIVRLQEESCKLAADQRSDEGDMAKIRANIYGIGKTIIQVQGREKGKGILNGLRDTWSKNLETAREHSDVKQIVIEEIKLEILTEILSKLEEV